MAGPEHVRIDRIGRKDTAELADLFEELSADAETVSFFHPHPLTRHHAVWLCGPSGPRRDRYYLARREGKAVGYSMLRGWEEGYEVPSFGGCVRPAARGTGVGHALLAHAVEEARRFGAGRLRLSVYRSNARAVRLYAKFGFVFEEKNARELIGWLDLGSALPPGEVPAAVA